MTIAQLDELTRGDALRGRRVFVRADLNVPLAKSRSGGPPAIADDTRIRASLPTVRRLIAAGARVILASHLGRPKGRPDAELSLKPVAQHLGSLLGIDIAFASACTGPEAERAAADLADGEVLLLENLRFDPGETAGDEAFAKALAELAEVYVDDAFGTAHRAHASTTGMVAHFDRVAAGLLLADEIEHLGAILDPERPLLCLIGGAKVSDKLGVLEALASRADCLAVGGAMAYTFLAALNQPVGASRVETERIVDARRVLAAAEAAGCRLLLPVDHVVAQRLEADADCSTVAAIPEGWMGLDIGPQTAALYAAEAEGARTILWNGPMGVFEMERFAAGTAAVARAVAASPARSVVGGGDSLAAINQLGLAGQITHLSTGGGASLEFVQGQALPGVEALER